MRVSQGSLPIGERAADRSDAVRDALSALSVRVFARACVSDCLGLLQVVEKKKPSAEMHGRVMAVLHCEDGFVVTAENYCRIPVLGYARAFDVAVIVFRCVAVFLMVF